MYAFLGEINAKISDSNSGTNTISHRDFYENCNKRGGYFVIIDRGNIDFSLENIKNCTLVEAHAVLRCKRKLTGRFGSSFMIPKKKYSIFHKNDFFIQTDIIDDCEILEKLNHEDRVFLVEHIISELCRNITEINEDTWWMYIAEHVSSGVKIIVGLGQGIVVSRILPANTDPISGIHQTIQYVRRHGFIHGMKIISFMKISIDNFDIIHVDAEKIANENNWNVEPDIELLLMKFASKNKKARRFFYKNNLLANFVDRYGEKTAAFLLGCFFVFLFIYLIFVLEISREKTQIKKIQNSSIAFTKDKSKTFSAKITSKNFAYIKYVANILKNIKNPLMFFCGIDTLLRSNKITPHAIIMKEDNTAQISCVTNKNQLENLKKYHSKNMDVVAKADVFNGEYDEIYEPNDKNFSTEICVKKR